MAPAGGSPIGGAPRASHCLGIVRLGEIDGDVAALRGWDQVRSVTIETV